MLAAAVCVGLTACSDTIEEAAPSVDEGNNGNNGDDGPVCPQQCPASTTRVLDSAAACGFRCDVAIAEDKDATAICDDECPEGFERVVAPQTECEFTCLPIPVEDGSSFIDAEPLDVAEDVEGDEDAVEGDVPESDAD